MEPRIDSMKASKAISVLVDASTDSSTRDLIAVYVRHMLEGHPVNTFLGVGELQHCHAEGYITAIDTGMNDLLLFSVL